MPRLVHRDTVWKKPDTPKKAKTPPPTPSEDEIMRVGLERFEKIWRDNPPHKNSIRGLVRRFVNQKFDNAGKAHSWLMKEVKEIDEARGIPRPDLED